VPAVPGRKRFGENRNRVASAWAKARCPRSSFATRICPRRGLRQNFPPGIPAMWLVSRARNRQIPSPRHAGAANTSITYIAPWGRRRLTAFCRAKYPEPNNRRPLEGSRNLGLERNALVQREQGGILECLRHAIGSCGSQRLVECSIASTGPTIQPQREPVIAVAFRHRPQRPAV